MDEFRYPDHNDTITQQLINMKYDTHYWDQSERRILKLAMNYLRGRFGEKRLKELRLLDLGCGTGRLIPYFAGAVGSVTALEPDPERCNQAVRFIQDQKQDNVSVLCMNAGEYRSGHPAGRFDIVLCSHVFQHITHETFRGILRDLTQMTGKEAVFIFTTTYTSGRDNKYTLEFMSSKTRRAVSTDLEGFTNSVGLPEVLPVCMFSRHWIEKVYEEYGLTTRLFSAYHFQGESDAANDESDNLDPEKLKNARDAFYLCEKSLPGNSIDTDDGTADDESGAAKGKNNASAAGSGDKNPNAVNAGTGDDGPVFPAFYDGPNRPLCGPASASGKICYTKYYYVTGEHRLSPPPDDVSDSSPHTDEIRKAFETSEKFLYGGGLHFQTKRQFFGNVDIRDERIPITESHGIVSMYPEVGIVQIAVNLTIGTTAPDNFVYLHQVQTNGTPVFTVNGEPGSIPGVCSSLLKKAGMENLLPGPHSIIIELNSFGERADPEDLSLEECRCLYGILTGDEGYSHVPESLARRRLEHGWTSRDFVRVVSFAGNCLLINLNHQQVSSDYIEIQRSYAKRYYGSLNDYFTMDAPTAGINHGVFFSLESGMLIKTTSERLLSNMPELSKETGLMARDDIRRSKKYREEMISSLNKISTITITELGELDRLILEGLGISEEIESLKYLLELVESQLGLLYDTSTNRMVNIFTVAGLILALIEVVTPFIM